jgi:hypothetical protein
VLVAVIVSVCTPVILMLAARLQAAMLLDGGAVRMGEPFRRTRGQVRPWGSVHAWGTCRNRFVHAIDTPAGLDETSGRDTTESDGSSQEES